MSKRNIAYIKPEEPNFLKRLKQEIGYKEGPDVETKRQNLPAGPEDLSDTEDSENPQVVVLGPGDLTEQEANKFKKDQEDKPADLGQKIIFKPRAVKEPKEKLATNNKEEKSKKLAAEKPKPILSFQDDDDADED